MTTPWKFASLRRKWRAAQRLHALEHATQQERSLSCAAVGHWAIIDEYADMFDHDEQRKFLAEYSTVKYA